MIEGTQFNPSSKNDWVCDTETWGSDIVSLGPLLCPLSPHTWFITFCPHKVHWPSLTLDTALYNLPITYLVSVIHLTYLTHTG